MIPPGQNLCFSVSGYSMCPLLFPGYKVVASPQINTDRICIGDLVVITDPQCSGIVVHRVVLIRKRKGKPVFFLTKGDGSRTFDKVIYSDQILGKVIAIKKENRFINLSKTSWRAAGFFIAVSSGACGLMHRLIGRYPLSSGTIGLKIGFQIRRLFFLTHRMFIQAVILSLS